MAHLLNTLGQDGHIYAIENHVPTIDAVRAQLRRHDLERFVTIVAAPLVERQYPGVETLFHWYDLGSDAVPAGVDLLIVDGPVSTVNELARYPAGPELLPKLSRDAHVFAEHDTGREDELRMLRWWRKLYPDLGIRHLAAEKGCAELFFLGSQDRGLLAARVATLCKRTDVILTAAASSETNASPRRTQPASVTATLTASATSTVL